MTQRPRPASHLASPTPRIGKYPTALIRGSVWAATMSRRNNRRRSHGHSRFGYSSHWYLARPCHPPPQHAFPQYTGVAAIERTYLATNTAACHASPNRRRSRLGTSSRSKKDHQQDIIVQQRGRDHRPGELPSYLRGRSHDRRPTSDRDSPRRTNGNAVTNPRIRA